jgi:Ca2+-binding RTX toxin-like protein
MAAGPAAAAPARSASLIKQPRLQHGTLVVEGTSIADTISLRLQPGQPGTLLADIANTGGSAEFRFARADISSIEVDAGAGDDAVSIDESGGVFTDGIRTSLAGGAGNDRIDGGSGAETLIGGPGDDSVDGKRGNDVVQLGAGDDAFVWNPGDGSDVVDGQAGADTMRFEGANVNEHFELSARYGRLELVRDVAGITMDTDGIEQIDLDTLGGADTVTVDDLTGTSLKTLDTDLSGTPGSGVGDGQADQVILHGTAGRDRIVATGGSGSVDVTGLRAAVHIAGAEPANDALAIDTAGGNDAVDASALAAGSVALSVDAGAGNDTVAGSAGNDVLLGGDGNDTVDGNQGADTALLGAGDDTFAWDPGDGSDVVEGQDGSDRMVFNGSNAAEQISLSANGSRLRLARDVGAIVMDANGLEQIDVNAAGGADTVTAGDLTGTGVARLNADLGAADGQRDHVVVNGTSGPDAIRVTGSGGNAAVTGLATAISVTSAEPANDALTVAALAGADTVDASGLAANAIRLEIDGGDDADVLTGSRGNDLVNGGRGNDVASLGAGDDTFVWNPGDGSDVVDGQTGADTMLFNGANVNENIDLSANGSRLRLFRDVANITMDTSGIETVDLDALGGSDTVTVGDLAGTGVSTVNADLAGTPGSGLGDGQADHVIVIGTNAGDVITASGANGAVAVTGLATRVNVTGAEPANDTLAIDAVGGDDAVVASRLAASSVALTIDGGAGADVLVGSAGNDILLGGDGDDVLNGGPGLDTLDGGPGNNVLFQD